VIRIQLCAVNQSNKQLDACHDTRVSAPEEEKEEAAKPARKHKKAAPKADVAPAAPAAK